MATKAIIGVDIDPEGHFKAFYDMFQSFEEKLDKLPEGWKQVGDASKETTEAFAAITGALAENMATASSHAKDLGQYLQDASKAQKEFGSNSSVGAKNMKSMADDAKTLGHEIFGIGKFLFKMGAVGVGAVAGSLFGLDALANGAVANRQAARSLGLTTGKYRAFENDLSTYIDPSTLEGVANAQNDLTKQPWLTRASGMSKQEIQSTDAGTLAAQLALKAHDWWVNNPDTHDIQHFAATGFGESGFGYESVRQLGNTSRGELERGRSQYQKDSQSLNYGAGAVDALYDFSNKLKLAGQHLETDLADKLSQLNKSGALSSFITNLEKSAETLINGALSDANLKAMQDGIQTFATYLGSQSFKDDVKGFVADLKDLAQTIHKVVHWADPVTHPAAGSTMETIDNAGNDAWDAITGYAKGAGNIAKKVWSASKFSKIGVNALDDPNNQSLMRVLEKDRGLPAGSLGALASIESSGNANARSDKGAMGLMQLMPATAKALGVMDPWNAGQNLTGGADLLAQLQKRYGGDLRKEIAAFNWNPASLDKDIASHGKDWERYAPQETQGELRKFYAALAKQQAKPTQIVVTNKTGNNVAVSTNAAAI